MILRKDIERLVRFGVLKEANDSKWRVPSVDQLKSNTNWVGSLSDFRALNRQLKRKPYPMPKIHEMTLELEVFKYDTSLVLIIGYYHIHVRGICK